MKKIVIIVIGVVVLAAGFFASYRYTHVFDFLKREPLSIKKTANIVEEIKKIGEFTTACYYEEMTLQDSYTDTAHIFGQNADKIAGNALKTIGLGSLSGKADKISAAITTSKNEIVLIGKGHIRAGFDLSKIQESDISIKGDTLNIAVPPAEVFDIIMNPSDFSTEYEKGTWSHELTKPIKEYAKVILEQNAIENGILKKAEENGKKQLEAIFTVFGFKHVNIIITKADSRKG